MEKFTPKDIDQLKLHELSPEKAGQQLETFKTGIPFVEILAPAILGNGIQKPTEQALEFYAEKYDENKGEFAKFVPASGAATRMFKDLLAFKNEPQPFETLTGPNKEFFEQLPNFAFYEHLLSQARKQRPNFDSISKTEQKEALLESMLDKNNLNFSELPKGLVPFHKYSKETRTAFEEHFFEAMAYSTKNNFSKLYFTIAENQHEKFEKERERIQEKFKNEQRGVTFQTVFSHQAKSTDTIAANMENEPFRDENGNLVLRPAGHGALLENLNKINADMVFIKNIDNVSTENNLPGIAFHKKILAGILIELQNKTSDLLKNLETSKKEAKRFLNEKLNVPNPPENISEIKQLLDRPIRVCGMVKNTGAPGGGPFWIKDENGTVSLQIVETAQIDQQDPRQKEILGKATHFNPVDLVCGLKNYKGEKFDLLKFSNPKRGFISQKSMNGRNLKALELPGLWNGAMEYWNTVFVEVPLRTFNPVKTVVDLLKPGHQEKNHEKKGFSRDDRSGS